MVPPNKQVGVRGRIISSQSREIIGNVLKFMKNEAVQGKPLIPLANYKQRLIEATGISDKVYRQVFKDLTLIEAGEQSCFTAPTRGSKAKHTLELVEVIGVEEPDKLENC